MRTSQVALFLLLLTTSHVFLCTAADIESARHRRLKLALRPSAVADRAAEEEDANRSLVETQAKLEPTSIAAIVLICTVVLIESYHVVLKFKLKKIMKRVSAAVDALVDAQLAVVNEKLTSIQEAQDAAFKALADGLAKLHQDGAFKEEDARLVGLYGRTRQAMKAKIEADEEQSRDPNAEEPMPDLEDVTNGVDVWLAKPKLKTEDIVDPVGKSWKTAAKAGVSVMAKAFSIANVAEGGELTAALRQILEGGEVAASAVGTAVGSIVTSSISLLLGFKKVYSMHKAIKDFKEWTMGHKIPAIVHDGQYATCELLGNLQYLVRIQIQQVRAILKGMKKPELKNLAEAKEILIKFKALDDAVGRAFAAPKITTPDNLTPFLTAVDESKLKDGKPLHAAFTAAINGMTGHPSCTTMRPTTEEVAGLKPVRALFTYDHSRTDNKLPSLNMYLEKHREFTVVSQEQLPVAVRKEDFEMRVSNQKAASESERIGNAQTYVGGIGTLFIHQEKMGVLGKGTEFMDTPSESAVHRNLISGSRGVLSVVPHLYAVNEPQKSPTFHGSLEPTFKGILGDNPMGSAFWYIAAKGVGSRIVEFYYAPQDHQPAQGKKCFRTQLPALGKGVRQKIKTIGKGSAYLWFCKQAKVLINDGEEVPHDKYHPLSANYNEGETLTLINPDSAVVALQQE